MMDFSEAEMDTVIEEKTARVDFVAHQDMISFGECLLLSLVCFKAF